MILPLLLLWLASGIGAIFFATKEEFTIAAIYNAVMIVIAAFIIMT